MAVAVRLIDPGESLDYTLDWSDYLVETGSPVDTIAASSWIIEPQSGSPQVPNLRDARFTDDTASVFVEDAEINKSYRLTNQITTDAGRIAERSVVVQCEHR